MAGKWDWYQHELSEMTEPVLIQRALTLLRLQARGSDPSTDDMVLLCHEEMKDRGLTEKWAWAVQVVKDERAEAARENKV